MSIQFSNDGPLFPSKLLDALLSSEVVFICGAGVSAPQLVDFKGLVTQLYARLDLSQSDGEKRAFDAGRYEEVLGSLGRRLVHPSRLYDEVGALLAPPISPDLVRQHLLLRLSRDLSNRPSLITTNFDLLFERAIAGQSGPQSAAKVSVAGQALPAPGSEDFAGVIHLHGRLADASLGLDATPLVLTSAEYGDAYMRSGWASRFLFDLARCKTLVLVGYSASDAPMRYFLNVLEADRDRFTDLRPIYALDAFDNNPSEVDGRWSTLAVQPLPFRKTVAGKAPFSPLWEDLDKLATLVERPRPSRRQQLEVILAQPFEQSSSAALATLDWLQRGRGDLWDRIIATVEDPAWFDHFTRAELWQPRDHEWLMPMWFARAWTSEARLRAAVRWLKAPNREVALGIERELARRPPSDPAWRRAWHVLAQVTLQRAAVPEGNDYDLALKLRRPDVFDLDLREAVDAVTPQVVIEPHDRYFNSEVETPPQRMRDFYDISLGRRTTDDDHGEVLAALLERRQDVPRLAQLASNALRNSLAVAEDLDLIGSWDELDYGLPSVADHAQNQFHGGVLPLVRLLAGLLPALAQDDRNLARSMAASWTTLPSRVGRRMWVHALANIDLFSITEVVDAILALSEDDFWAHRRELPVLLTARFGGATEDQRQAVINRVFDEGPRQFEDEGPRPGETDWRPAARAHAMWLRLSALREAGALTDEGQARLAALRSAYTFLGETLQDEDYFSSYVGSVRSIEPAPLPLEAEDLGDRLDVAHKLIERQDQEGRRGWAAFCRTQPGQAFKALSEHGFREQDIDLWRDLLNVVLTLGPYREPAQTKLLRRIFTLLAGITVEQTQPLLDILVEVYRAAPRLPAVLRSRWWDKLWATARATVEVRELTTLSSRQFYDRVINNAAGKLAEELLKTIDAQHKAAGRVSTANWRRLRQIFRSDTITGHIGRAACMRAVAFLVYLDAAFVTRWVAPWLSQDNTRSATLRSIFAEWSSPTVQSSRSLKPIILRCAEEASGPEANCRQVAAKILLPLIRRGLTNGAEDWGFSDADTRRALMSGSDALRIAAAQTLAQWHRAPDVDPVDLWKRGTKPVFKAVWPVEKRFKSADISKHLAALCFLTKQEFPDAVNVLGPYLTAGDRQGGGLFFLLDSKVPDQFPEETLSLLWLLLRGCADAFTTPAIAKTLDAIMAAAPALETDRRFQWLESKAMRFA